MGALHSRCRAAARTSGRRRAIVGPGDRFSMADCSKNRLLKWIRALPTGEACDADLAPKSSAGTTSTNSQPKESIMFIVPVSRRAAVRARHSHTLFDTAFAQL